MYGDRLCFAMVLENGRIDKCIYITDTMLWKLYSETKNDIEGNEKYEEIFPKK